MSGPPDIKALWQAAPEEIPPPDFEAIRKAARRFQRRKALANAVEYVAAAVTIVMFAWVMRQMPGVMTRLGCGLGILWALFYVWQRHRLITTRPVPDDAAACFEFHRRELERQRDVVLNAWRWTLAPAAVVVGILLMARWFEIQPPGAPLWRLALMVGVSVLYGVTNIALFAVWFLYRADRLQAQIDDLDRIGRPPS